MFYFLDVNPPRLFSFLVINLIIIQQFECFRPADIEEIEHVISLTTGVPVKELLFKMKKYVYFNFNAGFLKHLSFQGIRQCLGQIDATTGEK